MQYSFVAAVLATLLTTATAAPSDPLATRVGVVTTKASKGQLVQKRAPVAKSSDAEANPLDSILGDAGGTGGAAGGLDGLFSGATGGKGAGAGAGGLDQLLGGLTGAAGGTGGAKGGAAGQVGQLLGGLARRNTTDKAQPANEDEEDEDEDEEEDEY
ncbi:hypothetical protein PFICI_00629 [Pestalotiopsis fici W106-1]|uniref:Uncharacterized protein n=1 Tax=Pestalotiopsis fici (strain W106-1 / CGMCC3.15140) TaxID=1229662 RepID=W3XNH1_PESFW|nr:uncharacterized protein PFICI_00629 [Pestalotiopsis fici W106-1]ETS86801.1 hypothetical protein PFICI_00629 [Pestalotiopsis fici W106-1]